MSALSEFKDFISKGNVIDLAVAFVIAMAFTAIVTAFVAGIITPLIGLPGKINLAGYTITVWNAKFLIGSVLDAALSFLIIALVVFFGIVRPVAKMRERAAKKKAAAPPTTRECPECLSQIPRKAKRCSFCTSTVTPVE